MKQLTGKLLAAVLFAATVMPLSALAADQDIQQKIDALTKEVESLKHQVKHTEEKSLGRWLTISGDYRFRYDYLRGEMPAYYQLNPRNTQADGSDLFLQSPANVAKNSALYTNRFGLNLKAKATENVSVTARFLMYKVAGAQNDAAIMGDTNTFFSDRAGLFDGTIGHVPGDSKLSVDRVFATWNNIADQPLWFSIGRRPSTGGVPSHLKQDTDKPGNAGVPALLVDYAFDGVTLGYAPDIDHLTGGYMKLCYGRGFQNDIQVGSGNELRNTDMVGFNLVPYDTDLFRAEFQYNRGMNIFNSPVLLSGPFQGNGPSSNLGDIDWYGLDFLGKVKNVGIGHVNWFVDGGISQTHPNNNTVSVPLQTTVTGYPNPLPTGAGLMYTGTPESKTGWAVYVGGRYDIEKTGTKLGLEYNHGSKDWITFAPAADDMWTSKLGVRGNVYEGYIIQELPLKPISSYVSKAFFRIGYQYYDFEYTGSNNWVGAPVKISDLNNPANGQMLTPLKNAQDVYVTFEVHF
jgi:Protein of unknown function (DUF3373)